jgi:hypothetical protein
LLLLLLLLVFLVLLLLLRRRGGLRLRHRGGRLGGKGGRALPRRGRGRAGHVRRWAAGRGGDEVGGLAVGGWVLCMLLRRVVLLLRRLLRHCQLRHR